MQSALLSFYRAAVKSAPSIDVNTQKRVFALAKKRADDQLMCGLLARVDLDPEIDEKLGQVTSAKVMTAWFGREGRTSEQIKNRITREKRVTVLEVIASQPGLDAEIYETCSKTEHLRVAAALACNEDASDEVRRKAAHIVGKVVPRQRPRSADAQRVARIMAEAPQLGSEIALATDRMWVLVSVVETDLSPEACTAVKRRCLTYIADTLPGAIEAAENGNWWYRTGQDLRQTVQVLTKVSPGAELSESEEAAVVESLTTALAELEARGNASNNRHYGRGEVTRLIRDILEALNADGIEGQGSLAAIADAKTPVELEAAMELALADADWQRQRLVITAGLCNKAATVAQVERFGTQAHIDVRRIVEKRRDDLDVVVAVLRASRFVVFNGDLASLNVPGVTPQELWLRLFEAEVAGTPQMPHLVELLKSHYATPTVAGKLPFSLFAATSAHAELPGWVVTEALTLIQAEIGDDPDYAENFETLGDNFAGSIEDLLEIAQLHSKLSSVRRTEPAEAELA